jgi:hypothetical protein
VLAALLGAALAIGHALARAIGRRRSGPRETPVVAEPVPPVAEPVASR